MLVNVEEKKMKKALHFRFSAALKLSRVAPPSWQNIRAQSVPAETLLHLTDAHSFVQHESNSWNIKKAAQKFE